MILIKTHNSTITIPDNTVYALLVEPQIPSSEIYRLKIVYGETQSAFILNGGLTLDQAKHIVNNFWDAASRGLSKYDLETAINHVTEQAPAE